MKILQKMQNQNEAQNFMMKDLSKLITFRIF